MKMIIQSPGIRLTKTLDLFLNRRFAHLEKLSPTIIRCEILLKSGKAETDNKTVEAKLLVPGNDLFASRKAAKFEVAADLVVAALESQLRKQKGRILRKGTATPDVD